MERIYNDLSELIGNTPLVRVGYENGNEILVKLECFNPYSVKDRVAKQMILDAEKSGKLKAGTAIVEPTSGNTGIGLALIAAVKGYKLTLTMPDTMSVERRKLLSQLGAEIVLTEGAKGMNGAIAKAEEIAMETGAFLPSQFDNPSNPEAHKTTAMEILADTDGKLDYFISAVGTGGTLTGTGRELKKTLKDLKIVAVEPENSPVISGGAPGKHKIQGIGAGFIPKNLDVILIDETIKVSDENAFETVSKLARSSGILCGISGGAALFAAYELSKRVKNARIVVILADSGERYLSIL